MWKHVVTEHIENLHNESCMIQCVGSLCFLLYFVAVQSFPSLIHLSGILQLEQQWSFLSHSHISIFLLPLFCAQPAQLHTTHNATVTSNTVYLKLLIHIIRRTSRKTVKWKLLALFVLSSYKKISCLFYGVSFGFVFHKKKKKKKLT